MNAERLETARRLVACPKWVWLPGMAARGISGMTVFGRIREEQYVPPGTLLPDLDDDLTRLGVLALVRQAWNHPRLGIVAGRVGLWCVSEPRKDEDTHPLAVALRWQASTEEDALLAALEAAPT